MSRGGGKNHKIANISSNTLLFFYRKLSISKPLRKFPIFGAKSLRKFSESFLENACHKVSNFFKGQNRYAQVSYFLAQVSYFLAQNRYEFPKMTVSYKKKVYIHSIIFIRTIL